MEQFGNNAAEHSTEYITVIKDSWPLIVLSVSVAFASTLYQLKRGYKQRTFAQQVVTVVANTIITSSVAMGCALLLPVVCPVSTPEAQIGVVMIVGSLGAETIKQWLLKKLGLSVIDLKNPQDINEVRETMTPEQRKEHAERCPFRKEECKDRKCGACIQ